MYIRFSGTTTSFGFKLNLGRRCIYRKISGSKSIFLVLYLLPYMGQKTFSQRILKICEMQPVRFEMFCDRSHGLLELSQETISKELYRDSIWENVLFLLFQYRDSKWENVLFLLFHLCNVQRTIKRKQMEYITYAFLVASLICTRPIISFTVGILGRY